MLHEKVVVAFTELQDVRLSRVASADAVIASSIGVGNFEPGLVALLPVCLLEAWCRALWHLTHVPYCSLAFPASATKLLAV